jgi:hypothetical protein
VNKEGGRRRIGYVKNIANRQATGWRGWGLAVGLPWIQVIFCKNINMYDENFYDLL